MLSSLTMSSDPVAEFDPPRLTEDQIQELRQFLRLHHPPFALELDQMEQADLFPQLPNLLHMLYTDMQRFRAQQPTRYVTFLGIPEPSVQ